VSPWPAPPTSTLVGGSFHAEASLAGGRAFERLWVLSASRWDLTEETLGDVV